MSRAERNCVVYDGRNLIGSVHDAGSSFDAFDARGNFLGTFPNVKLAVAAVNTLSSLQVCDAAARLDGSALACGPDEG